MIKLIPTITDRNIFGNILIGPFKNFPDINTYLSNLSKTEIDYARDLFRARNYKELERFLYLTDDKVTGTLRLAYIEILCKHYYSIHKPLSKNCFLPNQIASFSILPKSEIKTNPYYTSTGIDILDNRGYQEFFEEKFLLSFLNGEIDFLSIGSGLFIFSNTFKAWISLWYRKNKE